MDITGILELYGPFMGLLIIVILLLAGVIIKAMRDAGENNKLARELHKQASDQTQTALSVVREIASFIKSVADNTQAVETAVIKLTESQEKHLERLNLALTATIADTVASAASKAEESRQKWNKTIEGHFLTLFKKVEKLETRLDVVNGSPVTNGELEELARQLQSLMTEMRENWANLWSILVQKPIEIPDVSDAIAPETDSE